MSFRLTNCKLNTINSLEMYLKRPPDIACESDEVLRITMDPANC
ncbi:hypothetical protein HanHA300_Chr13g0488031 [Helianthus annuus]|nr:hypothetical protein HanHA300_Chr13g0488031 [Helianthus annuus]KAJ0498231.1 hypothetical protein HanHA89_Chr13g0520221 [Helianthus annuus]KAJ0664234.1 hypothetical protein HanLR1_Chr13g0490081 [Helianthus annuus]